MLSHFPHSFVHLKPLFVGYHFQDLFFSIAKHAFVNGQKREKPSLSFITQYILLFHMALDVVITPLINIIFLFT